MTRFYIPYSGPKPVEKEINGHRLVFLTEDPEVFEEQLDELGADTLHEVQIDEPDNLEEVARSLNDVTDRAQFVMVPSEIPLEALVHTLEEQLPWLQ